MFALPRFLRRRKRLLGSLRRLHYRVWQTTGVSGITRLAPELLDLDELTRPSLQWFLLSGNPPRDAETEAMRRKFLTSGALVARAMQQLLTRVRPDKLVLLNGIFFAERIAIELARRAGIPFITH